MDAPRSRGSGGLFLPIGVSTSPASLNPSPSPLLLRIDPAVGGAVLQHPVALRCAPERADRADPRGTHCLDDAPNSARTLPRPRAHLRSRSYGDSDLPRAARRPDGPVSLQSEPFRRAQNPRSFSPASTGSVGSSVTDSSPGSADWPNEAASARRLLEAAVASATGRELAPTLSDLSAASRAPGSGGSGSGAPLPGAGGGWGRRRTGRAGRALSLSLAQSDSGPLRPPGQAPFTPVDCLSTPNLRVARCACARASAPASRLGPRREFAVRAPGGTPGCASCACRADEPSKSGAPRMPAPERGFKRFLKKTLNWAGRQRK